MKYAIDEIERRWLAVPERLPELRDAEHWVVEDRYIHGTRMRLRRMTRSGSGEVVHKLCKKYGKTGPITEPITNLYLDAVEYDLLQRLPGCVLVRRRYPVEHAGLRFSINVAEAPSVPIIVEREYASEAEAAASPVPPFCGTEISTDPAHEGVRLSALG